MASKAPALVEELQEFFLEQIGKGTPLTTAALRCGITTRQALGFIASNEAFRERYQDAVRRVDDMVEQAVLWKAIDGDQRAAAMWLANRRPKEWGADQRLHAGSSPSGHGPVQIAQVNVVSLRELLTTGQAADWLKAVAEATTPYAIEATSSDGS